VIRLIAEYTGITVFALVSLGDGCRLAVAGTLGNFTGYTVPSDDPKKRIGDKNVLERNLYVIAVAPAPPVVEGDESTKRSVDGA